MNSIPLNERLLRSEFETSTNWCVLTGAPASGKSVIARSIESLGVQTETEVARNMIERRLANGESLEVIRGNEDRFQREVMVGKWQLEAKCRPDKLIIFDRAMPDSISYYRVAGVDPNNALPYCFTHRYRHVFLFERVPFVEDPVRAETETQISFLNEWLARDYASLGYNVIRIPALPVEERLSLVLKHISDVRLGGPNHPTSSNL